MNSTARQTGSSLIEVMVTVLILSTSLLGMAALQNRSLQYNHSAYLRSQANILAYDILDRIRINRANTDSYKLKFGADAPAGNSLVQSDLREWREIVAAALPEGNSAVSCTTSKHACTVIIQWTEQNSSGEESEDSSTFEYTTKI
ncbi:type IV pilus modification protein PilV [Microbulbifer rhizosphaerae]|uniref:Type IV pilus assembly protein PilV n=1 Tax=Microbulbifer rhizosphaerae TaxID=1562603 RepID=A0A7W4WDU8_9GAMM|nr:type IV pilus modification protein PilV [Microbulbifer rhizosphaerae]MBB3062420.1 type IV pilus assembly protein PilV [Microbulbifer rhizosphaerae]